MIPIANVSFLYLVFFGFACGRKGKQRKPNRWLTSPLTALVDRGDGTPSLPTMTWEVKRVHFEWRSNLNQEIEKRFLWEGTKLVFIEVPI